MGLVKTRRLAAMRKQTTYAKAMVVKQRAKAGAEVLPMWKCCQFQCCQFPIGDWQRQTTEWNVAKLPNGFAPNYRMVIAWRRLF